MEEWRTIEGYEGMYEVSSQGNVRSLPKAVDIGVCIQNRKEKFLKQVPDGKGYMMVWFYKDGKRKMHKVHRLVAKAFIPNTENKPEVDHINADKADNRMENLRWVTSRENFHNPITYKRNADSKRGVLNHKAKAVVQMDMQGNVIREWGCMQDATTALGKKRSHITDCCLGLRDHCLGYKWKYKDDE